MNSDLVIFVDGYLSDKLRANACSTLIDQLREHLPYKIALLNKYPFSWGLDHKVDYYFHHGEGFMVGKPPQNIIDKELYERPYVYVDTHIGTLENWLPFVGVSDHVANMYNSFILTSETAKNLGFKRVFKVEADTLFDSNDLVDIAKDIETFKDYLLYGERQEGDWAKPHQRIMDIHISGYSVDLFDGFELIKNDKDFWSLCERIGYYGKWIEYIIPTLIYYQEQRKEYNGIKYEGKIRQKYPNTKFDLINSPGEWTQKWENIPKPCRVSPSKDQPEIPNHLGLFYWNDKKTDLIVNSTLVDKNDNVIYQNSIVLSPLTWIYDSINLEDEVKLTNQNTQDGTTKTTTTWISPETIVDLNTRFIKK